MAYMFGDSKLPFFAIIAHYQLVAGKMSCRKKSSLNKKNGSLKSYIECAHVCNSVKSLTK